jgi:hypothetical protein
MGVLSVIIVSLLLICGLANDSPGTRDPWSDASVKTKRDVDGLLPV